MVSCQIHAPPLLGERTLLPNNLQPSQGDCSSTQLNEPLKQKSIRPPPKASKDHLEDDPNMYWASFCVIPVLRCLAKLGTVPALGRAPDSVSWKSLASQRISEAQPVQGLCLPQQSRSLGECSLPSQASGSFT